MSVEEYMVESVVTVGMDDTLRSIRDIFEKVKFHQILVVSQVGVLRGVITERDVFKHLSPFLGTPSEQLRDVSILRKPAHQIMTRKPVTATLQMPVAEAADMFVNDKISCLPVIDEKGHVLGIITRRDILRACICLGPGNPENN